MRITTDLEPQQVVQAQRQERNVFILKSMGMKAEQQESSGYWRLVHPLIKQKQYLGHTEELTWQHRAPNLYDISAEGSFWREQLRFHMLDIGCWIAHEGKEGKEYCTQYGWPGCRYNHAHSQLESPIETFLQAAYFALMLMKEDKPDGDGND